jgi:hypothetical protein
MKKKCLFCEEEKFDENEINENGACPDCAAQLGAEDEVEDKLLAQEIQEELESFNREAGYAE